MALAEFWAALYAEFGTDAVLTVAGTDHAIRAIDRTAGSEAGAGGPLVQTVEPAATVTAADVAALGLTQAQLDDATLVLNGTTWRVTSARPMPVPYGAGEGEYLLLLEAQ